MAVDLLEGFRCLVERPDEQMDLAGAALEIARDEYNDLNVSAYLSRLDQLAVAVDRRLGDSTSVYRKIAALNTVLFQEQGFHGNRESYYDPKNSFLNEVLERKTGIPITLSVLYIELALRIGLPLCGIGFPGHFLVKHVDGAEEIVIDPFNEGAIQSTESLNKLLEHLYRGEVTLHPDLLEPVAKKQILRRMLNNLKLIYLRDDNLLKALGILQRLVILDPGSTDDIRDRAIVYSKLECFSGALADFETYLQLAPEGADARAVKEEIIRLSKRARLIH